MKSVCGEKLKVHLDVALNAKYRTLNVYDRASEEMSFFSIFIWHNDSDQEGLVTIHINNFENCGTASFHKNVIKKLYRMFKISKREPEFSTHVRILNKKETKHLLTNSHYVKGDKEIRTDVERKKQL